jgi:hypothetical protein
VAVGVAAQAEAGSTDGERWSAESGARPDWRTDAASHDRHRTAAHAYPVRRRTMCRKGFSKL